MRATLNCYAPGIPTGLGTLSHALWKCLPFEVLLAVRHPKHGCDLPKDRIGMEVGHRNLDVNYSASMLKKSGTTHIVAVERVTPPNLFKAARLAGIRTVLIVMHEWLNKDCEWLPDVDLFITPNEISYQKTKDLCWELGATTKDGITIMKMMPPLDLDLLPFTERTKAERFVFSNGWGGVNDRKGWPEMRAALELMSEEEQEQVKVWSQKRLEDSPSGCISPVEGLPQNSIQLRYEMADVAVVPSRCEGLGLAVLEPMALGLPVLATCAEPMSEMIREAYGSLALFCLLPVEKTEQLDVWKHPVTYSRCHPQGIVDSIRSFKELKPELVAELSRRGRAFVERQCGPEAVKRLMEVIRGQGN